MGEAFITRRGGGGEISLSVKAYASALQLPISAKENDIAVITSTPFPKVIFGGAEPTDKTSGAVWLRTSNISNYTVAVGTKQIITISPYVAYQSNGSAYINIDAYIYKSNSWVKFNPILYKDGIEYFAFEVGGALCKGLTEHGVGNPQKTFSGGFLEALMQGGTKGGYYLKTVNKIAVSGYSSLSFSYKSVELNYSQNYVQIWTDFDPNAQPISASALGDGCIYRNRLVAGGSERTMSVDLTGMPESLYLGVAGVKVSADSGQTNYMAINNFTLVV